MALELELAPALEEVELLLAEGSWVLASLAYYLHEQLKLSKGTRRLPHQNQHEQSAADISNSLKKNTQLKLHRLILCKSITTKVIKTLSGNMQQTTTFLSILH